MMLPCKDHPIALEKITSYDTVPYFLYPEDTVLSLALAPSLVLPLSLPLTEWSPHADNPLLPTANLELSSYERVGTRADVEDSDPFTHPYVDFFHVKKGLVFSSLCRLEKTKISYWYRPSNASLTTVLEVN